MLRRFMLLGLVLAGCSGATPRPPRLEARTHASGGALLAGQGAYDVLRYDLDLTIVPKEQAIDGRLVAKARVLSPLPWFVLDLDDYLRVGGVEVRGKPAPFEHAAGRIWVWLDPQPRIGEEIEVVVKYGGRPRVAPNPPWSGGFIWSKTPDGKPWIATSCQMEGSDLWWPCKDHPSDKPDSMDLRITVPEDLVCAANGVLVEERKHGNGTRMFHWRTTTPSSNYVIALNIAPYEVIRETYASLAGEMVPVFFWVLPQNVEAGRKALPHFLDDLKCFEELCGPYPFRAEKYGIVETPHLGMEHKTIIAYGNRFRADPGGYDWLHNHELSHEWWGNLVTCRDWKDMWIHEGIGTYMQALFLERRRGRAAYHEEMARKRGGIRNLKAVAPRETQDSVQIYSGDIYFKGSWIMHTLRWLLGDETFFKVLRRLAYPDPAKEKTTDGSATRLSDTEEIRAIAERVSGRDLGWFFEVYLRQPALPVLVMRRDGDILHLEWKAPGGIPFPMPVAVKIGEDLRRLEMPARVEVPAGQDAALDPESWILK